MLSEPFIRNCQRRAFLRASGLGVGSIALSTLLTDQLSAQESDKWPGVVQPLHHPARAKRVIFLCMAGGPSHLETFDYKPKLAEMDGQPMPESITQGQPIAQLQGRQLNCLGPQHPFKTFGQSGQEI